MTSRAMNPDLLIDDSTELTIPEKVTGRAQPVLSAESEPFWTSLADGQIVLAHCGDCGRWNYLPAPGCPWCGSSDVRYEAVEGSGELYSFTVSYLEFGPGVGTPYVVGIVVPDCDAGARIVTNVIGCKIRDVRIGARLTPVIVPSESGHLLFYRPALLEDLSS